MNLYYISETDWVLRLTLIDYKEFKIDRNIVSFKEISKDMWCGSEICQFLLYCIRTDKEEIGSFYLNNEHVKFLIPGKTDDYTRYVRILTNVINGNDIWDNVNIRNLRKSITNRDQELSAENLIEIETFYKRRLLDFLKSYGMKKPYIVVRGLHDIFQESFIICENIPMYKHIISIARNCFEYIQCKEYIYCFDKITLVLNHVDVDIRENIDCINEAKEVFKNKIIALHPFPIRLPYITSLLSYHDNVIWFFYESRVHTPYLETIFQKMIALDHYKNKQKAFLELSDVLFLTSSDYKYQILNEKSDIFYSLYDVGIRLPLLERCISYELYKK